MDRLIVEDIAWSVGANKYAVPPDATIVAVPQPADASVSEALALLAELKRASPGYRDPETKFSRHFKTKSKRQKLQDITRWRYPQEALDNGLRNAIDRGVAIQVVAALVERLGAKSNLSHDLSVAIERWDPQLTALVLLNCGSSPSQTALDCALEKTLAKAWFNGAPGELLQNQTSVIESLLAQGANVEACKLGTAAALEQLVQNGHVSLCRLLLRGKTPLPSATLSRCLLIAVQQRQYDIVASLLAYGADPNANDAAAVRASLATGHFRTFAALLAHSKRPLQERHSSSVLQELLTVTPPPRDYKWLKMLLYAGAQVNQPCMIRRLVQAVESKDMATISLLVTFKPSVAAQNFAPLRAAIAMRDKDVIRLLLSTDTCTAQASTLLPLLDSASDYQFEVDVTEILVDAGATGKDIDQRLVSLVEEIVSIHGCRGASDFQSRHLKVLVRGQAHVDHHNGAALKHALAAGNVPIVECLSQAKISKATLSSCLCELFRILTGPAIQARAKLATHILLLGVEQEALDDALELVIENCPDDKPSVQLLLSRGARVDRGNDGGLLVKAVNACGEDTFKLLVSAMTAQSRGLGKALLTTLSHNQLPKAETLLGRGCAKEDVNKAMITEIRRQTCRMDVLDTLLSHGASVDYRNGEPLVLACVTGVIKVVQKLLDFRPSAETAGAALKAVVQPQQQHDERNQLEILKLLSKNAIAQRALDDAMKLIVAHSPGNSVTIVQMLLSKGANPSSGKGEALKTAVSNGKIEILRTLLSGQPEPNVVLYVFQRALKRPWDLEVLQVLFATPSRPQQAINEALIEAVDPRYIDEHVLSLFLSHGGSVNYRQGEALARAVKDGPVWVTERLVHCRPSQSVVNRAVSVAMDARKERRLDVLNLLLNAGPAESDVDKAIYRASSESDHSLVALLLKHHSTLGSRTIEACTEATLRGDHKMLEIFVPYIQDGSIYTLVFDAMNRKQDLMRTTSGFLSARILLDHGVNQRSRDRALLNAVKQLIQDWPCQDHIDTLLKKGADVNGCGGEAVCLAAEHLPGTLFLQFHRDGISSATITKAMPGLFRAGLSEGELLSIVGMVFGDPRAKPDVSAGVDMHSNLLMSALTLYPSSSKLVEAMLEYGYRSPSNLTATIWSEIGRENVSVVMWALLHQQQTPDQVFSILVEANLGVDTPSSSSFTTPLLLAARQGRSEVVSLLLSHAAKIRHRDWIDRTALSYASQYGHIAVVRQLTACGSELNDGSLQEAAREMNRAIVEHLLESGHNPDFPSSRHDGRSGILELLLKASVDTIPQRHRLTEVAQVLLDAGSKRDIMFEGKRALFCALHNDQPLPVVTGFLETEEWKHINDPDNIYIDPANRCYSPTEYLQRGPWQGDNQLRYDLLTLLRNKRCIDRYYMLVGHQPPGAVGLPKHLQEIEDQHQQDLRDQASLTSAHNLRMSLRREMHEAGVAEANQLHELTMQHDHARSREQEQQQQRISALACKAEHDRHVQSIQFGREIHMQQIQFEDHRHQLAMKRDSDRAQARRTIQEHANRQAVEHQTKLITMQETAEEHQRTARRQIRQEDEQAAEREHQRIMNHLDHASQKDKEHFRLKMQLMESQRSFLAEQRSSNMLRIGNTPWDQESVD